MPAPEPQEEARPAAAAGTEEESAPAAAPAEEPLSKHEDLIKCEDYPLIWQMVVGLTSEELINIYYQQVPVKPDEVPKSFYSNEKAKRLLGFKPEHSWRDYI